MDDRIHEALGHQERAKYGVSDGGDHLGGQPARGVVRKQGQRLLEGGALDPLHEDERVVLARSVAIDARKSAQVRDGTQMTVLLEQCGGVGQVRGRLLGGAVGGLAGKDGVVLEQLDGKDLAARVGRAQHVPDVAVVAVGRLENKRHKPTLGVVLGAGVDRHGGVERVETDEFVAIGAIGSIHGVPLSGMGCCAYTWAVWISVKYHDSHTAHVYR